LDRICAYCGAPCTPRVGVSQEIKTTFFGGRTGFKIALTGKQDLFFCNDDHRDAALYPRPVGPMPPEVDDED
jgi:hypothetical protein